MTQFEKLWGDMTALPEIPCSLYVVPRRGQHLKHPAQLDGWLREGTAYVELPQVVLAIRRYGGIMKA